MVRLKVRKRNLPKCSHTEFQFQNGSIKRLAIMLSEGMTAKFQFQNGSIKSWQLQKNLKQYPMFQFQNGSIKRSAVKAASALGIVVSIPKWFD